MFNLKLSCRRVDSNEEMLHFNIHFLLLVMNFNGGNKMKSYDDFI